MKGQHTKRTEEQDSIFSALFWSAKINPGKWAVFMHVNQTPTEHRWYISSLERRRSRVGRLGFSNRTLWALTVSGSRTHPRETSKQNQLRALQTPPNSTVLWAAPRAEHPVMCEEQPAGLCGTWGGICVCCHGQKQAGGRGQEAGTQLTQLLLCKCFPNSDALKH